MIVLVLNFSHQCHAVFEADLVCSSHLSGGGIVHAVKYFVEYINQILKERGWTTYRLSAESGLSHTTLANVFRRNTVPSITTLEKICNGFGITLSQFFAEGEMVELTPELKQLFDRWINLTAKQKDAVIQMMDGYESKEPRACHFINSSAV